MRPSTRSLRYDAVIIGSGPNGLAAGITLARAGKSVLIVEGHATPGGGMRSSGSLTLPGFVHDVCSAIHPLAAASPFFRTVPLAELGVELIHPPVPIAQPLDGGRAGVLHRSVDETALGLGTDATAYRDLVGPLAEHAEALLPELLAPFHFPRHPILMSKFGLNAIRSAAGLARAKFAAEEARAIVAGNAAHSVLPLDAPASAAVALILMFTGHAVGWPVVRGGSQKLADALVSLFASLGGELVTNTTVDTLAELPEARAYLFDTTPRAMSRIAAGALPASFRARLDRYRHGPGVFKIDYALAGPIPWSNADCRRAGTVHVCGTLDETIASERACWSDAPAERPFVLLAQQSIVDDTRAPAGKHTGWAYCHVPPGCTVDMTGRIEAQIERFAPGFRDLVLARHAWSPRDLESYNPNLIGGDVTGGVQDLRQLFTRPTARPNPYTTPNKRIYLCSASTPPGGGVHGMAGWHAARAALRRAF